MYQKNITINGVLLFLLGLQISITSAQSTQIKSEQTILTSSPDGAYIQMIGEYTIRGLTPLKIPYKLEGLYSIKATRYGYEKWTTIYDFTGENEGIFEFNLKLKSRFKAGLRSFFFPGWGQYYSDRKFQGVLFSSLELVSVIYTINKWSKYNKIVNEYDSMLKRFEVKNLSFEERNALKERIVEQEKKADDAYEERQRWFYITASVWAFNIFDAILFFHYDIMRSSHELYPTVSAFSNGTHAGLNFKWDF